MSRIEDLSAITTPSLTDLLYIYQNGSDYKITNQQLLDLIKANSVIPLTQAQYDALPSEEKNNGAIYIITDASVTISDIAGANTFIHDMSFASSFDNRSEIAINETTDGLGQKKIFISQLKSLIQSETEIDDLKDVVMSHKANNDIIIWNSQGGISGQGGWENLGGLFKVVNYQNNVTVSANGAVNITGNDLGYTGFPSGYYPIAVQGWYCSGNDIFARSITITNYGSASFCVLRNVSSTAFTGAFGVSILFVKSNFTPS